MCNQHCSLPLTVTDCDAKGQVIVRCVVEVFFSNVSPSLQGPSVTMKMLLETMATILERRPNVRFLFKGARPSKGIPPYFRHAVRTSHGYCVSTTAMPFPELSKKPCKPSLEDPHSILRRIRT